jgi:hypothetical protein
VPNWGSVAGIFGFNEDPLVDWGPTAVVVIREGFHRRLFGNAPGIGEAITVNAVPAGSYERGFTASLPVIPEHW